MGPTFFKCFLFYIYDDNVDNDDDEHAAVCLCVAVVDEHDTLRCQQQVRARQQSTSLSLPVSDDEALVRSGRATPCHHARRCRRVVRRVSVTDGQTDTCSCAFHRRTGTVRRGSLLYRENRRPTQSVYNNKPYSSRIRAVCASFWIVSEF